MNGEQAAASLFGPEDPTSDPFASLGSQQSPVTEQDFFASFPVADPPVADSTDDVQSVELTGPAQPVPYIVNEPVATGWYDDFGRWNEQSVEQAPRTDPSLAFPPSSTSVEAPTYPQPVPVSTHDTYVPGKFVWKVLILHLDTFCKNSTGRPVSTQRPKVHTRTTHTFQFLHYPAIHTHQTLTSTQQTNPRLGIPPRLQLQRIAQPVTHHHHMPFLHKRRHILPRHSLNTMPPNPL